MLMTKSDPFKYFHSSPEIIRLAVMMVVLPLSENSLRNLVSPDFTDREMYSLCI